MSRFDFWTHGVATIVESPLKAQLIEHRAHIGTVVEQNGDTNGWFHIPIPTPTTINNYMNVKIILIGLIAKVNKNARIDELHLYCGSDRIWQSAPNLNLTNKTVSEIFDPPDFNTLKGTLGPGIVLSIFVNFLPGTPRGRVEFYGAGAAFSL